MYEGSDGWGIPVGDKTLSNLELVYKFAVIGHFIGPVGGQISYWNMRVLMPGSKLEHCGHDVLPCNTHKTLEWLQQKELTEMVLWHRPQFRPIPR